MSSGKDLAEAGRRLVETAAGAGVSVRLIGGVAIWIRGTEGSRRAFERDYPDFDVVAMRRDARALRRVMEEAGYVPDMRFNAIHGAQRLMYAHPSGQFHVDVFLDELNMSHRLNFAHRMALEAPTLPAADLLLTKLQIAELNRKDATDCVFLLASHAGVSADGPGCLNVDYIARQCAQSWGLFTTASDNLAAIHGLASEIIRESELSPAARASVEVAVERGLVGVRNALATEPKTLRWSLRARVGRRVPWHAVPEEVNR